MSYVNETVTATGMSNWLNAQIALTIKLPTGNTYVFTDYIRMSVNRNSNFTPYHAVGKHNKGYIKLPKAYSFSITVPVSSQDVDILRMLHNTEAIFDFEYADAHAGNIGSTDSAVIAAATEFKLIKQKLVKCIITSMADSYETEGLPQVVFNGSALDEDFVAQIGGDFTGKSFGDNSLEVTVADLSGYVEPEYWDIT